MLCEFCFVQNTCTGSVSSSELYGGKPLIKLGWTEWLLSWYEPQVSSPLITGIVPRTVALKFGALEDKYLHPLGFITIN